MIILRSLEWNGGWEELERDKKAMYLNGNKACLTEEINKNLLERCVLLSSYCYQLVLCTVWGEETVSEPCEEIDGSVDKVVAGQMWGPEFRDLTLTLKVRRDSVPRRRRQAVTQGLLARQHSWTGNSPGSKNNMGSDYERQVMSTSGLHTNVYTWAFAGTSVHTVWTCAYNNI